MVLRAPALLPPRLSPTLAASHHQQQPQQQPWLCRVCFAGHLRGKFPGHLATEPGVVSDREATLAALQQQQQQQQQGGGPGSPPLQSPPRPSAVGSSLPSSSAFSPSPSRPAATPFKFDPGAPCSMGHRGQAVVLYCLDCAGKGGSGAGPLPLCSLCVPLHTQQFRHGHATLPAARVAAACRAHLTSLCEAAGAWPAPYRFSLELVPDPASPKPASRGGGGLQYFESPALVSRGGDRSARRLLASRGGSTSQGGRRPATSAVMLDPAVLPSPNQQQQQQGQQQPTARSVIADIAGAASAISRAALAVAQAAADAEAAAAAQFGAVVAAAEARRTALVDRIRAEAASKAAALAEELAAAEAARERAASDCGFVARAARSLADAEVVAAHAALVARLRAMFGAVAAALPPGAPAPAADTTLVLQRSDTAPIVAALGSLGDVAAASVTAADCRLVGIAPGQTVAPGEKLRFSLALSPESESRGGLLASRAALARLVSAASAHVTLGPPAPEEDEDGLVPTEVPEAPQRLRVAVEFDDDLEEGAQRRGGGCGVWLTCTVPAEAAAAAAPLAPTPLPVGGAAPVDDSAPLAMLAHSRRPRVGSGGEGQVVAAARPPPPPAPPAPSAAPLVLTIVSVSSGRWSVPGLPLRLRVEGSGGWGGSLSHRSASPLSQSGGSSSSSAALAAGTGLRDVVPRGRRLSASSYPHQHPHPYHVHIHAEPPPPLPLLSATLVPPPPLIDHVLGGGGQGPLAATAAAAAALRKKPGRDGSRSPSPSSPSPSHTVASNYALSAAAAHPPPPLPMEALPLWFTQPALAHTHFAGGASGGGGGRGGSFVRSRGGAVTPLQLRPGAASPAPVLLPPVAAAGAKLPTRIPGACLWLQ